MTINILYTSKNTENSLSLQMAEYLLCNSLKQFLDAVADLNKKLIHRRSDFCYFKSRKKYKKCCINMYQKLQESLKIAHDKKIQHGE